MISKTALRLFALLLCLAAAVPQVGATARVYVRCDGADPNSSYLYVWGSSEAMGGWRGKKLSEMSSSNFNGYTYYYVDINQSTINLILNSSNGGQTPDISISNSGSYYITYKGGSNYSGPAEVPDGTFYVVGGDTNIFPNAWDWQKFWMLTAFISIILAVMNILPIPGLDGGHIVLLFYEGITGRQPSDKAMEWIEKIGIGIIIALMLLAMSNDVRNFILPLFGL